MGFLEKISKYSEQNLEKRSEENEVNLLNEINEYSNDFLSSSSSHISKEGALGLSAVWACCRLLTKTTGILPIHLFKSVPGGREIQKHHQAHKVLQLPNSHQNRHDVLCHLVLCCMLWGNGYVRIHRDKYFKPNSLELLHPRDVEPVLSSGNKLFYRVVTGELVDNFNVLHIKGLSIDGIKGISPIQAHRENLVLTKSAQEYGTKFFTQGGNMSGTYNYPGSLSPEAYKRLQNDLTARTMGMANVHKALVLEGGLKYERVGIPPEDAQFIATRKFQKTEIATIYGVPPHMIADLDRATNNNIEQQGIEFVNYCLMPYLVELESEFNRKLLTSDEFWDYYFKFNVNALLRGDAKSRGEFYRIMTNISALNPNEVRALEDMNPYDGGDIYFHPMNMGVMGEEVEKDIIKEK